MSPQPLSSHPQQLHYIFTTHPFNLKPTTQAPNNNTSTFIMKFIDIASLALALVATTVNAGCFSSGLKGDTDFARSKSSGACDREYLPPSLSLSSSCTTHKITTANEPIPVFVKDGFTAKQRKTQCFNYSGDNRRYEFTIYNLFDSTRPLDHGDCVSFLNAEIACEMGGDRTYEVSGIRIV